MVQAPMFHVEHVGTDAVSVQNSGPANCRLKRRGKRDGQVPVERIALYPAPP